MIDFSQNKRAVWGWVLYDWANSAFSTTIMAGFFPLFFKNYFNQGTSAVESTSRLGVVSAIGSLIVAVLVPFLGTLSDFLPWKKKFLLGAAALGVGATCALAALPMGAWIAAAALYVLASAAHGGSSSFYDSLLPGVTRREQIDYVSGLGYAMGYLGGGLLFALNVVMVQKPHWFGLPDAATAVKWSFVSAGVWWAIFSLPLAFWVQEPPTRGEKTIRVWGAIKKTVTELSGTFARLAHLKMLLLFLLAFFVYNDGVGTVIKMAVDYGSSIGFQQSDLILALLLVQFVGFPFAIFFGKLSQRFHPKRGIYICLAVYLVAVLWAAQMKAAWEFYVLAGMVGMVQGGVQSVSRSYYARFFSEDRAGEFYGLYNLLGKFTGIVGPLLIAGVATKTQETRFGIVSVSLLFVVGALLLFKVDDVKGKAEFDALFGNS